MTALYIARTQTCPTCKGEKVIQPKIWADYWGWIRSFRSTNGRMPTPSEEPVWAKELPPEEVQCPDCEGTGITTERVEVTEVLATLRELAELVYKDDKYADISDIAGHLARAIRNLEI